MKQWLFLIVSYGPVLGVIYWRVKKRSHPSRNVLINWVILSVCLALVLAVGLDIIARLDTDRFFIEIAVTVMILAWVRLWRWLMRRFERPKSRP